MKLTKEKQSKKLNVTFRDLSLYENNHHQFEACSKLLREAGEWRNKRA